MNKKEYRDRLQQIKQHLEDPTFIVDAEDSTYPGDKYTKCNIGFCGEGAADRRARRQRCPMDWRCVYGTDYSEGCFYTCTVFQRTADREDCLAVFEKFEEDEARKEEIHPTA